MSLEPLDAFKPFSVSKTSSISWIQRRLLKMLTVEWPAISASPRALKPPPWLPAQSHSEGWQLSCWSPASVSSVWKPPPAFSDLELEMLTLDISSMTTSSACTKPSTMLLGRGILNGDCGPADQGLALVIIESSSIISSCRIPNDESWAGGHLQALFSVKNLLHLLLQLDCWKCWPSSSQLSQPLQWHWNLLQTSGPWHFGCWRWTCWSKPSPWHRILLHAFHLSHSKWRALSRWTPSSPFQCQNLLHLLIQRGCWTTVYSWVPGYLNLSEGKASSSIFLRNHVLKADNWAVGHLQASLRMEASSRSRSWTVNANAWHLFNDNLIRCTKPSTKLLHRGILNGDCGPADQSPPLGIESSSMIFQLSHSEWWVLSRWTPSSPFQCDKTSSIVLFQLWLLKMLTVEFLSYLSLSKGNWNLLHDFSQSRSEGWQLSCWSLASVPPIGSLHPGLAI